MSKMKTHRKPGPATTHYGIPVPTLTWIIGRPMPFMVFLYLVGAYGITAVVGACAAPSAVPLAEDTPAVSQPVSGAPVAAGKASPVYLAVDENWAVVSVTFVGDGAMAQAKVRNTANKPDTSLLNLRYVFNNDVLRECTGAANDVPANGTLTVNMFCTGEKVLPKGSTPTVRAGLK